MKKIFFSLVIVIAATLALPSFAFAHVVVKPNQAGVGAFTDFTVGVPVERDMPTVSLRLVMPEDLNFVTPLVKPGWKVDVKKKAVTDSSGKPIMSEDGDEPVEVVSEIIWSGGEIPPGFKDTFTFSAQTPTKETTLQWKAYQTYKDKSVVSWEASADSQPKDAEGKPDFSKVGPYSETKVIDDLSSTDQDQSTTQKSDRNLIYVSLVLSLVALAAAGYSTGKRS